MSNDRTAPVQPSIGRALRRRRARRTPWPATTATRTARPAIEAAMRPAAHGRVAVVRGGGAEAPQAAAPAVLGGRLVGPTAPAGLIRLWNRPCSSWASRTNRRASRRQMSGAACVDLARGHDEQSGVVVGAVAACLATDRCPSACSNSPRSSLMRSRWAKCVADDVGHDRARSCASACTSRPSCAYGAATLGPAQRRSDAPCLGGHRSRRGRGRSTTERMAVASAVGFRCGTTMPAPLTRAARRRAGTPWRSPAGRPRWRRPARRR